MSIPQLESPATIADLERVGGKAEIVNGKLVLISPTSGYHGMAALNIASSLKLHQRAVGGGSAYADNVAFVVSEIRSFSPDVAWHPEPAPRRLIRSAPLLAVEIRSESTYGPAAEREMTWKRADYFAAGTQVVWDVDVLREELIRVYPAHDPREPGDLPPRRARRGRARGARLALSGGRDVRLIGGATPVA
jgi:Uma2 family endonuclease